MGNRTLVYTCCDKKYSHFIPLYCAALLYSNDEIDIEIGLACNTLDPKEASAIQELQKLYPKSKILLKYNFFEIDPDLKVHIYAKGIYRGKRMMVNSVRFVSEPMIKDDYTYISDIDIISLDKNFYLGHIKNLNDRNMIYDNIVRPNNTGRLSGLHFVRTKDYYPLDLSGLDFFKQDEILLKKITEKKTKINYELCNPELRPVHGPHISLNRPYVAGTNSIPGWGVKKYKNEWKSFKMSNAYKAIENSFDPIISKQLTKLDEYYTTI